MFVLSIATKKCKNIDVTLGSMTVNCSKVNMRTYNVHLYCVQVYMNQFSKRLALICFSNLMERYMAAISFMLCLYNQLIYMETQNEA